MAKARSKKSAKGAAQAKSRKASGGSKAPSKKTKVKRDPIAEYQATIQKQGIASVVALSDDEAICNIRGRVSTQSLALDRLLKGVNEPAEWSGGIPLGRVTEIYGPPHIGKSTILDHCFAHVQ